MNTSEAMTHHQRIRVHVSMPNGWCRGCWWEYRIFVRHPCGWRQGAERVVDRLARKPSSHHTPR